MIEYSDHLNNLKILRAKQAVPEVYKFQPEDKEGYITRKKLLDFMTQNFLIFEANVLNIDILWTKYSSNNKEKMNYGSFSAMMRVLNVETFKFRNNKRIIPRVMNKEKIKTYKSRFGIDLKVPFSDRSCTSDKDCPG